MSLQKNRTFVDTPTPKPHIKLPCIPIPCGPPRPWPWLLLRGSCSFPMPHSFPYSPLSSPTCTLRLYPNATSSGKACPLFPGSRLGAPWGWMAPAVLVGTEHERAPCSISLPSLTPRLVFLPPQRISASAVAPGLQYFGMSVAGGFDISGDGLADITVGTLGRAVVFR